MSEEHLNKLFQAFAQADTSTTRQYGGTGLGLTISKTLVEMMEGKIWVESEPNIGSTFHFTVSLEKQTGKPSPLQSKKTESQDDVQNALAKLYGARVLLVEDNSINAELAQEILTTNGISVEVVHNGQEAINILEHEVFDGVLMDCHMPLMDGYQATQELRNQERYTDLPILAMTANAMKGDKEKVLDIGMNDYIAKPINVNQMFITMAKWISSCNKLQSQDKEEANDLPADIFKLPGIDAKLSPIQHRPKLYRKLLKMFAQAHKNFEQQFNEAKNVGDDVICVAHNLKGVAGNIGATEVYSSASLLEEACKNNDDNRDKLLEKVVKELNIVISSIEKLH